MRNNKQIVFIVSYSAVMLYKMSKIFRKKGYETVLIRMFKPISSDMEFYKDGYDKIIDFNILYFKPSLKNFFLTLSLLIKNLFSFLFALSQTLRLKPYVILGRANPNIMTAFFRIIFLKTPFIYFPYDIHAHWASNYEEAKIRGISFFEIKAERFCFEHSEGVMHKGAPEELNYINGRILGDNIKLPKFIINFYPYCAEEFIVPINKNKLSKKDKEIHLVFVASAGKQSKENYVYRLKECKYFLEQKIHIHLYLSSNTVCDEEYEKKLFFEEYKNYPNIKYFHIESSLDPKSLNKEISKYDFGISPHFAKFYKFDLDRRFFMGNKVATYLEAGISFFYRKDNLFVDRLMKKYKLNLNYPKSMKKFKETIKKLNYTEIEKNIIKARQDYLMEKHFPRLEEFIKKVVGKKTKRFLN